MEGAGQSRKKFIAGTSLSLAELTGEATSSESLPANSWSSVDATTFQLRTGPDYQRTKAKSPSGPGYYEIVGADFFKSSNRIDNVGSKVTFPESWTQYEENAAGLPPIFILNAQAPSDFTINFSFFTEINDGEGWSLILYFKITQETINLINSGTDLPPALKLLQQYCKEAPSSFSDQGISSKNPWAGRFKAIGRIEHIEEYNLANFITQWNAKPVLIRQTGSLIRGEHYLEMDVNIHRWGNIARQGISALFSRFGQMVNSIGFCIESVSDEEMPENLFGCGKVIKLDPVNAVVWEDLV